MQGNVKNMRNRHAVRCVMTFREGLLEIFKAGHAFFEDINFCAESKIDCVEEATRTMPIFLSREDSLAPPAPWSPL